MRKFAVALACLIAGALALLANQEPTLAAPALQLPWPSGHQHRINGGWTYGCPAGYPYYGTHDRLTNSDHYNADYYAIDFQFGSIDGSPLDVGAVAPGIVIYRADRSDGYGNKVVIDHGGGYYSVYAHLSSFAVSQWQLLRKVRCSVMQATPATRRIRSTFTCI